MKTNITKLLRLYILYVYNMYKPAGSLYGVFTVWYMAAVHKSRVARPLAIFR